MKTNVKTFLYRGCPRCGGDLMLERESKMIEYACVQCGRTLDLRAILEARRTRPTTPAALS